MATLYHDPGLESSRSDTPLMRAKFTFLQSRSQCSFVSLINECFVSWIAYRVRKVSYAICVADAFFAIYTIPRQIISAFCCSTIWKHFYCIGTSETLYVVFVITWRHVTHIHEGMRKIQGTSGFLYLDNAQVLDLKTNLEHSEELWNVVKLFEALWRTLEHSVSILLHMNKFAGCTHM